MSWRARAVCDRCDSLASQLVHLLFCAEHSAHVLDIVWRALPSDCAVGTRICANAMHRARSQAHVTLLSIKVASARDEALYGYVRCSHAVRVIFFFCHRVTPDMQVDGRYESKAACSFSSARLWT